MFLKINRVLCYSLIFYVISPCAAFRNIVNERRRQWSQKMIAECCVYVDITEISIVIVVLLLLLKIYWLEIALQGHYTAQVIITWLQVCSSRSILHNIKPFQAILSNYSGFCWLKTVVLSLCRTTVVCLVTKSSHITDLTLR